MDNSGDDISCAEGPARELLSLWFPRAQTQPVAPRDSSVWWEVQGVELRPAGITALTGAFPTHLSFPNSRSYSSLHMGLHFACTTFLMWSLAADVKNWELKEYIRRVFSWPAELSWCFLHNFPPLFQNSPAELISQSIWSSSQLFQSLFSLPCITQHTSNVGPVWWEALVQPSVMTSHGVDQPSV